MLGASSAMAMAAGRAQGYLGHPPEPAKRPATEPADAVLRVGDLEIRPDEFTALAGGHRLALTVRELDLLIALAERSDRIVAREELYAVVWGGPYRKDDRSVDVYVAKLRQKLERALPGRRLIHTHFGFGYRLSSEG
jgi:DNA-binding response OmpR family regulator